MPSIRRRTCGDRRASGGGHRAGLAAEVTREAVAETQQLRQLRAEIAARLGQGDSLDSVERELIARSRLTEEQKSALWLYGWLLPRLERRRAALPYLELLTRQGRQPLAAPARHLGGD
jgi:hypothetical protein